LISDSKENTGNFYIDDEVMAQHGITDLTQYQVDPQVNQDDLAPDFFV